jgi:hypothetical protein
LSGKFAAGKQAAPHKAGISDKASGHIAPSAGSDYLSGKFAAGKQAAPAKPV